MKWKDTNLKTRLYLVASVILLVGLGSAVFVYLTAGDDLDKGLVYEFEHSNKYRHDLELYGGKTSLFADDLGRWFDGLWHGKSLALTIACITIFMSLAILFAAYRVHPGK